jgi:hypothetical protein
MIFISILILIVAFALPNISKEITPIFFIRITTLTLLCAGALAFNAFYIQSIGSGIGIYSGLFQVTVLSQYIDIFILIVGGLILISWKNNKIVIDSYESSQGKEYSLIILFSLLGSLLLVSSVDLISMYLSLELQSFGLYILSTLYKELYKATSAGLKYFLLGGLSSCIILLGSGLIYTYTGLTNLESIYSLVSVSLSNNYNFTELTNISQSLGQEELSSLFSHISKYLSSEDLLIWENGFNIGLILIFVGFLFKIAAAPLHNWAPALRSGKTLLWVKLSNSGNTLKLMVPSYSRKVISGQNNYLGMVTSHKMKETEMGNRGSKSDFIKGSVKEQRVDGSWGLIKSNRTTISNNKSLRYTLMGFERNYQIKIPSKQLNKFSFSTLIKNSANNILDPWFLTGFTDAEGSFQVSFRYDQKYKTKWRISACFQIKLHVKDIALLNKIKNTLGVGTITTDSANSANYNVWSVKDLQIIVYHFVKYPLITSKLSNYLLFKQCLEIIKKREHLTEKGLLEILRLKSSLNLGLSENLKAAFPNVIEMKRPDYNFKGIPNPFWVAGFISGDGSFNLIIRPRKHPIRGLVGTVNLNFEVCLNVRDEEVIKGLFAYFKSLGVKVSNSLTVGSVKIYYPIYKKEKSVTLFLRRFPDIVNIIIPFFYKYSILGVKSLDFSDFKKVAEIVKNKGHLNAEGFEAIKKIHSTMNLRRPWSKI